MYKEFERILIDTFEKYNLVFDPIQVINMLLKAGMEEYIRSILDYFHLLDTNQPYFARMKFEEAWKQHPIVIDLGNFNLVQF